DSSHRGAAPPEARQALGAACAPRQHEDWAGACAHDARPGCPARRRGPGPARGGGGVRGAGRAGGAGGRRAGLALGAGIRAAQRAPGARAGDRAAGLAGPAVPAHHLGTGAANPRRPAHLRRILHPVLAVAADFPRGPVVGVRARLHPVRRTRGRRLVAVAAPSAEGAPGSRRALTPAFFRDFLLAAGCGCPTLRLPACTATTHTLITSPRRGNTKPMAKKKATTKKAAAPKKAAKPAAPKAIKEPLSKSGLVAHIANATAVAAKDVRAVLGALEGAIHASLNKKGAGSFT